MDLSRISDAQILPHLPRRLSMQYLSRVNANEEDDILKKVIAYFVQTIQTDLHSLV